MCNFRIDVANSTKLAKKVLTLVTGIANTGLATNV